MSHKMYRCEFDWRQGGERFRILECVVVRETKHYVFIQEVDGHGERRVSKDKFTQKRLPQKMRR